MVSRTDRSWIWVFVAGIALLGSSLGAQSTEADPGAGAEDPSAVERRVSQPAAHGHDGSRLMGLDEEGFSDEQVRLIQTLEVEVMCACPRENWSRTLSNCPDACADNQKLQVRTFVSEGLDEPEVLQRMRQIYGPRVLATPRRDSFAAKLLYGMPFIILTLALGVSGVVISLWLRSSRATGSLVATSDSHASDAELDRVSAELEELD